MEVERLTIPHPHVHERAFMLVPLADIAADLQHPSLGRTIAQLAAEVDTTGVEPYVEE
jgi:2-amino-4-hydroxy-6-hydroxymethyldihydropteridine diphosphokinase